MTALVRELVGAEYPPRLRDLSSPPRVWVVGELPRGPTVGIVGTRHPSEEGRAFARSLARDLANEGINVFSGGAEGIDTAAHEGALDAGGPTAVIAPSSFDRPFPKENARLFQRVVDAGGAFLSRYAWGAPAFKYRFPERNRVLAALVEVVIVVETGVDGGSRITTAAARSLGRPVLVVPGPPWAEKGLGCVVELRLGAIPIGSFRDVLEVLGRRAGRQMNATANGVQPDPQVAGSSGQAGSGEELGRLRSVLLNAPANLDELHARTGIPVGRLQALLLTLTLDGVLVSTPSGQLSLVR
jgi:DNA processing protein